MTWGDLKDLSAVVFPAATLVLTIVLFRRTGNRQRQDENWKASRSQAGEALKIVHTIEDCLVSLPSRTLVFAEISDTPISDLLKSMERELGLTLKKDVALYQVVQNAKRAHSLWRTTPVGGDYGFRGHMEALINSHAALVKADEESFNARYEALDNAIRSTYSWLSQEIRSGASQYVSLTNFREALANLRKELEARIS
ncbi:hypothetical protein [Actinokineospora diospyrosa]|uniref:Uncharacterized protein n=1 Tax=Actinokineospora diospyrosa TaxID=103728 RepID=A0ABT1I8D0_9PSEU|nr:hypothetical protein [Actinokineospora diospyrosa]MCP2268651.1 hypothetical protein [Actinokineospora diospyrosa]